MAGQGAPEYMAMDATNLYWTDRIGSVFTCPIANCGTPLALATGQSFNNEVPAQIVLDTDSVYWGNTMSGGVKKCGKAGCGGVPTTFGSGAIDGLAVAGGRVYWTPNRKLEVLTCPTTGCTGNPATYAAVGGLTQDLWTLISDGTQLYWTDYAGTIYGCALGASCPNAVVLATGSNPYFIEVVGPTLYWSEDNQAGNNNTRIVSCPTSGCSGATFPIATNQGAASYSIATDGKDIYWPKSGAQQVVGCPVGGCPGGNPLVYVTGTPFPISVLIDAKYVYWSDVSLHTISRVPR
jgi:hypothetical protein